MTSGGGGGGGMGGKFFNGERGGSSVVDVPVPCRSSSSSPRCTFGWCPRYSSSPECSELLCAAETRTHSTHWAEVRGEFYGAVLELVDAKNAFDGCLCSGGVW